MYGPAHKFTHFPESVPKEVLLLKQLEYDVGVEQSTGVLMINFNYSYGYVCLADRRNWKFIETDSLSWRNSRWG